MCKHGVAGAVGRGAGALGDTFTEVRGHAAEWPLVNLAFLRAGERHAVMLQLDDRLGRLPAHVLDGVLIPEPVGALHGVVHVPAPVVLAHVAKSCADAALGRYRVAAGGEHLGDASRREPRFRETEGGAQASAAGTHHHHVVDVIDCLVGLGHGQAPKAMRRAVNTPAAASRMQMN